MYGQVFIDSYSRVAEAKLYEAKAALTSADLLNDRVLPWYQSQEVPLLRILTDRGSEYKGRVENHAYELYLSVEGIAHTTTKAYSLQTNGICERFDKTVKQEFFDVAMRKKLYRSLSELQGDLDEWLCYYNEARPHSGRYCYGKTPLETFKAGKSLAQEKHNELLYTKAVSDSDHLPDKKIE